MFVACHTESKVRHVSKAQQNNIINKKPYGSLKMHIKELTIVGKKKKQLKAKIQETIYQ